MSNSSPQHSFPNEHPILHAMPSHVTRRQCHGLPRHEPKTQWQPTGPSFLGYCQRTNGCSTHTQYYLQDSNTAPCLFRAVIGHVVLQQFTYCVDRLYSVRKGYVVPCILASHYILHLVSRFWYIPDYRASAVFRLLAAASDDQGHL